MPGELYPPAGQGNAQLPDFIPATVGSDEPNCGESIPWYLTAEYRNLERAGLPASASGLSIAINRIDPQYRSSFLELSSRFCRVRKQLVDLLSDGDAQLANRLLEISDEEFERSHTEIQRDEALLRSEAWQLIKRMRQMLRRTCKIALTDPAKER